MSALQRKPEWATTRIKRVNNRNNPVRRRLDLQRRLNSMHTHLVTPVPSPVRRTTPADICPTSLEPVARCELGESLTEVKTTTVILDNWQVVPTGRGSASWREGKQWVVVHSVPTKDREVVDRYYVSLDAALNRACALDEQRRTLRVQPEEAL